MKDNKVSLIDTDEKTVLKINDIDITDKVISYKASRRGNEKKVELELKLNELIIEKKVNLKDLLD